LFLIIVIRAVPNKGLVLCTCLAGYDMNIQIVPKLQHRTKRVPCIGLILRGCYVSDSLRFNGHLPGEPGLASVYWSKGWWRWWWQLDYWSYKSCKAPVNSSPPTNQDPVFYRPDALPVAQQTVSKHW